MKLDKLLRPFRPHKETQYYFNDLHWAYTKDGSFLMPFVINHDKTAIKDIKTDKIQTIPCRETSSQRLLEKSELEEALKLLYSKENIKDCPVDTDSIFIKLSFTKFSDIRHLIISNYQDKIVSYSDLKPLICQMKKQLQQVHKANERRKSIESNRQEVSEQSREF